MHNGLHIDIFGTKIWYQSDEYHRLNGPAIKWLNKSECWFRYGVYHRENGPACTYTDRTTDYFYDGYQIDCDSTEEFERIIKLKVLW